VSHLRNCPTEAVQRLRTIEATEDILIGDVVLLELLQGARDERNAEQIERNLSAFVVVQMLDPDLAAAAARNYRVLRGRGVTPNRIADLIIGTFCIAYDHVLLHDDRHFEAMRDLGLRVLGA